MIKFIRYLLSQQIQNDFFHFEIHMSTSTSNTQTHIQNNYYTITDENIDF